MPSLSVLSSGIYTPTTEWPHLLSHRFRMFIFNWDRTAIRDQFSHPEALLRTLSELLQRDVFLVIVTSHHFGEIHRQCLQYLPLQFKRSLYVCTNQGSEVFGFDERGSQIPLSRRLATLDENRMLDQAATALQAFLLESSY